MNLYHQHSLKELNTFGIEARTATYIEYHSTEELCRVLQDPAIQAQPILHIGAGSNLLFMEDFSGTVLHSGIKGIEIVGETAEWIDVAVGAGVIWDDWVVYSIEKGWYGIENLSIIPGEVGASAVQNIGAYGVEAKDVIRTVHTIEIATATPRIFSVEECQYAYRSSIFKHAYRGKYIVTKVVFRLQKQAQYVLEYGNVRTQLEKEGKSLNAQNLREVIIGMRESKLPDPAIIGNGGSFFMNPIVPIALFQTLQETYSTIPHYPAGEGLVKIPAGWLIEQAGWKGKNIGEAGVYEKQALVLINRGNATGKDIWNLATAIIEDIAKKFHITLHPEVNLIGSKGYL